MRVTFTLLFLLLHGIVCMEVGYNNNQEQERTQKRNKCPTVCKFRKRRIPQFQAGSKTFVIRATVVKAEKVGRWRVLTVLVQDTFRYLQHGKSVPLSYRQKVWVNPKSNDCTCFRLKKNADYIMAGYVKQPRNPTGLKLVLNETSVVIRSRSTHVTLQKLLSY